VAIGAYIDMSVLPEEDLTEDPSLAAIELGRRIGNVNYVLMASENRAEWLIRRGRWEEAGQLLADPLWQSAAETLRVSRLYVLATKDALQGHTTNAKATLTEALDDSDQQAGARAVTVWNEEAAIVQVVTGETHAALDWARAVLAQPEPIPWAEPLVIVMLLGGSRLEVENLAAWLVRHPTFDRLHREFTRSVVAVQAGDAASLAVAEALIAEAASSGRTADEVIWSIGLARWLPEGDADRARLMTRARDRIDESGFGGLARFLDP
jgi:hypothetical protein